LILITGSSGLLGANFVSVAHDRDEKLVAASYQHAVPSVATESVRADLTNTDVVEKLIRSLRPEWIVHCAAMTDVDRCEVRPDEAWMLNSTMACNLAAAAHRHGASFVYVSTDSVFDGETGNYSEQDIPRPLNIYARSKLAGENGVKQHAGHSLLIRTNIYGWNIQRKLSLAEWIISRLEAGEAVSGFHDVIFTPILVNDLSEIILDMMERRLEGLYHVAGSQSCSKYEFARCLANVFGLDEELISPLSISDSHLTSLRPRKTSLQTSKVSRAIGKSMPDVRAGLERFRLLRDSGFVAHLRESGGTDNA
jgi:dTDP-4-dehydrorhamnose reductase